MAVIREIVPALVSKLFDRRPTRWTPSDRLIGDFDGRERTLDVFYASAGEQLTLLQRLRPVRQEIEEAIGGPLLVIFHTPRETKRLYTPRLTGGAMAKGRVVPDKGIAQLIRAAVKAGWTLERGGKHPRLVAPDGSYVTIPSSPSCGGSYRDVRSALRKVGVDV